nr:PREDICTED: uncharacterized protein LOC109458238 isoform X3 [Rhinolophus sinicus]
MKLLFREAGSGAQSLKCALLTLVILIKGSFKWCPDRSWFPVRVWSGRTALGVTVQFLPTDWRPWLHSDAGSPPGFPARGVEGPEELRCSKSSAKAEEKCPCSRWRPVACFWASISRPRLQPTTFPPANHRGKYAAPKDHRLTGQLPEEQTRPSTQAEPCTQARGGCRSTGAKAERPASEPCTIDSWGKSTESRETVNGLYPRQLGTGLVQCSSRLNGLAFCGEAVLEDRTNV